MPVFEYKALTEDGKAVSGIIDADNAKSARSKLRKQGFFPTDITEERAKGAISRTGSTKGAAAKSSIDLSRDIDFKKYFARVRHRDVAMMTRQLATLLGAGVTLIESLTALTQQVENEKLKVILTQVREKVNQGASLADALREHKGVFSDLYVNMVGAGEQSGALDGVLGRLADYTESQVRLRSKVLGALTYPIIMMFVSLGVLSVLFIVVIPKITKIFKDMKIVLPLVTRLLIGTSELVVAYWWLAILLIVITIIMVRRWIKTVQGKTSYDRWTLKLPVFGRLLRLVALSRFANTLATLLRSGVPLLNALKIVRSIVNNTIIAEAIDQARDSIAEGHSIAEPLRRSGEFPALATHMIAVGEKSGQLEPMLMKVSEAYETEVDNMVSTMTTLLEPFMILFMGGVVMFIALSILLPMLQVTNSIR